MKKILPLLFVVVLSQFTKAQTWCPPGAQWHYRVSVPWPPYHFQDGYIQLNYAGTLTLGGQTCTQLSGTYYGVRAWSSFGGAVIPNYVNVATYESNKVIYAYNQSTSSFDTLVNFNATIGDIWLGYREGSGCEYPRPLIAVLDTSHVIINGQALQTVSVNITYPSSGGSVSSLIIEKIGPIHEFMIPHSNCYMHGLYYGDFVCYSDPNFQLYKKPGYVFPCDFNTVGDEEFNTKDSKFNIFPNPVEDKLRLEYYQEGRDISYVIVDVFGKVQLNKKLNGPESLEVKDLKEGVYFLLLYDQTKLLNTKKIVKN